MPVVKNNNRWLFHNFASLAVVSPKILSGCQVFCAKNSAIASSTCKKLKKGLCVWVLCALPSFFRRREMKMWNVGCKAETTVHRTSRAIKIYQSTKVHQKGYKNNFFPQLSFLETSISIWKLKMLFPPPFETLHPLRFPFDVKCDCLEETFQQQRKFEVAFVIIDFCQRKMRFLKAQSKILPSEAKTAKNTFKNE